MIILGRWRKLSLSCEIGRIDYCNDRSNIVMLSGLSCSFWCCHCFTRLVDDSNETKIKCLSNCGEKIVVSRGFPRELDIRLLQTSPLFSSWTRIVDDRVKWDSYGVECASNTVERDELTMLTLKRTSEWMRNNLNVKVNRISKFDCTVLYSLCGQNYLYLIRDGNLTHPQWVPTKIPTTGRINTRIHGYEHGLE